MARWFRSGLSVSASFVWRCLNSLSVLRFHISLIEPDMRISRIRLSDGHRLQAHATYSVKATSPEGQACSGIAWSFFGGYRLAPLSRPLFPSQAGPKSGPFPPPALPGFTGTTGLSAPPIRLGLALAGCRLVNLHHRWGFPCCVGSPCIHAVAITPAGSLGARVAPFPNDSGLPRNPGGSAHRITFFEACSAFTHVTACILAESPCDPLHQRL